MTLSPVQSHAVKPWLDGRLFAATLGDCGQRGRSGAIGGDLQRDVSTMLITEKALDRRAIPCDLFNIFNKLPTVACDCASSKVNTFITPICYTTNDVSLTYFVSRDRRQRPM